MPYSNIPASKRMLNALIGSCIGLASCGGGADMDRALLAATQPHQQAATPQPKPDARAGANKAPLGVNDGSLAWSNPATWGGQMPPAGAEIVIPAGKVITLDTDPPPLAGLRIEGTLRFARRDTKLTAGYIDVTGALEIGSPSAPFAQKVVITLNGQPQATNDGTSRGLNVRGGRLELFGLAPTPVWTKLNEHADAGTTTLTLKEGVNWRPGDTIAIAPTDFYGVAATERLTLAAASGNRLGLDQPLAKFRWGKLQYVTNTGMSLIPDSSFVPPALPAPTQLDERAAVGNLTRNIVIQGADDAAWQNKGFGAHIMVMGLASKVTIDGVEIRRAGQAGVTARYPMHWHMLSYGADGQLLGDAIGHVIRNSAIWNSSQRCVVIHATNGVQVLNNICQDIKGHAFFLEDAVERRNVLEGNLALMMRMPASGQLLQKHEAQPFEGGPSGFWLTNPDNTVRNNHAGDAHGNGFWMAFPEKALGLSKAVSWVPNKLPMAPFEFNTAHTAREPGLLLEHAPADDQGNTFPTAYRPVAPDGSLARHKLRGVTSFKNLHGAYRNRGSGVSYSEWVSADNVGTHMAGASDRGVISNGLFVGYSLNHLSGYPDTWRKEMPAAFATYNSSIDMQDNTLVNFPFVDGKTSGVFGTSDYYITGVNKGPQRNPNNRLVASHPGYRTPPPHMDGNPIERRFWTLSGALWDPHGYWGKQGQYWVYDVPFLTAGGNCQAVQPAGKNGVSCDGEYYGVGSFKTDFDPTPYKFVSAIEATRIDASGKSIGVWAVQDGANAPMLGWMRHFAAREGGSYILRFPGKPLARYFGMTVTNAFRDSDSFLFAVQFDGAVTATGYALARGTNRDDPKDSPQYWAALPNIRWFQPATSMQEVANSSGDRIWQDRANNLVWIKIKGGLPYLASPTVVVDSNDDLYRSYGIVIHSKP